MSRTQAPQFVLWGSSSLLANGTLIRLAVGSQRECEAERKYREKLGGYMLGIYAKGDEPIGLQMRVEEGGRP